MPSRSAIVLAVAAFLLTMLVRLPAAVLSVLLPPGIVCQGPSGTLWRGRCARLRDGALALAGVDWTLHPFSLLRGQLSLELRSEDVRARGSASVRLHAHGADVAGLRASLPFGDGLPMIPAGFSGQLEFDIASARLRSGRLSALDGTLRARAVHLERPPSDLGSFELTFPPPGTAHPLRGTLRDLGGPLALQGELLLRADGSYALDGTIAAREGAGAQLAQWLTLLDPPDAQGRRSFALSGTF